MNNEKITKITSNIRRNILQLAYNAGSSGAHIGGSFSMVEILTVLYFDVMNVKPDNFKSENHDRFILSKGHGALALYCVLKETGFITQSELFSFKKDSSEFWTHPCKNEQYGIEFSSGSLGQGLSIAAGVAYALRQKGNNSHVYVLIGDGECDEGSIWEAASFISHHNLNNITVIIDENKLQLDAPTKEIINKDNLDDRWRAFGFDIISANGHNIKSLSETLAYKSCKPVAIMAQTIKGRGISFIENNPEWHMHTLNKEQYEQAMEELSND